MQTSWGPILGTSRSVACVPLLSVDEGFASPTVLAVLPRDWTLTHLWVSCWLHTFLLSYGLFPRLLCLPPSSWVGPMGGAGRRWEGRRGETRWISLSFPCFEQRLQHSCLCHGSGFWQRGLLCVWLLLDHPGPWALEAPLPPEVSAALGVEEAFLLSQVPGRFSAPIRLLSSSAMVNV